MERVWRGRTGWDEGRSGGEKEDWERLETLERGKGKGEAWQEVGRG